MTDDLELRLSAMNVFDVHYRTFGSGMFVPGRNSESDLSARILITLFTLRRGDWSWGLASQISDSVRSGRGARSIV